MMVLEAGPFQPKGYFRDAENWVGQFSGYCFKLGDRLVQSVNR